MQGLFTWSGGACQVCYLGGTVSLCFIGDRMPMGIHARVIPLGLGSEYLGECGVMMAVSHRQEM